MDKHICKAKDINSGEWIYGYVARLDYMTNELFLIGPEFITRRIDQDTICRFTGKEDKYGNPIFENDICKVDVPYGPLDENGGYEFETWTTICVFDQLSAGFTCVCLKGYGDFYRWFGTGDFSDIKDELVEIVGNKFDNTNLMEEQ